MYQRYIRHYSKERDRLHATANFERYEIRGPLVKIEIGKKQIMLIGAVIVAIILINRMVTQFPLATIP
jgi:hypothetical protein